MIWKGEYAEHARLDLRDIYEYIAETLLEPETARRQTTRDAVHKVTIIRVVYSRRDIDRELEFDIGKIQLKGH
jgi:plasmid stabilization system protein ParE